MTKEKYPPNATCEFCGMPIYLEGIQQGCGRKVGKNRNGQLHRWTCAASKPFDEWGTGNLSMIDEEKLICKPPSLFDGED